MEVDSAYDKVSLGTQLARAYHELSNRGLVKSSMWIADAMMGLDIEVPPIQPPVLAPLTMQAKAYFDGKEYLRCWNAVKNNEGKVDSIGKFLYLFARYHAGEIVKENDMGTEIFVNKNKQDAVSIHPVNPYLDELNDELQGIAEQDPFLMYLAGVVARAKRNEKDAVNYLKESFVQYPFNWSCCLELKHCFTRLVDVEDMMTELAKRFDSKSEEEKVMFTMFRCFVNDEMAPALIIDMLKDTLIPLFPNFSSLKTQLARVHNSEGYYTESANLFEEVLKKDPYKLDDLDIYSNLLYVANERAKLAYLAQHVTSTDKYRAESCCVIANYYSLRGEHEQAVDYYERAIVLNRNYIQSWTLMGHEFIELGNPHAAIETYRIAVDLMPYDFRPLFGLGQAYEVLNMHYFAQYYFQRALALRPSDLRLWDALASCYEELDNDHEAISAFSQAYKMSGGDVYYAYRLAVLYDRFGNSETALGLMKKCAEFRDDEDEDMKSSDEPLSEWPARARLWLARHAMSEGNYSVALSYIRQVQHGTPDMIDEARSLEREAKTRLGGR